LTSEKDLTEQQELIKRVILNLINKDGILIRLRNVDDANAMTSGDAAELAPHEDDPFLVVHSNYVLE